MPYLKTAGALNLTGYQCRVCDLEVGATQEVHYDVDLGGDDKPVARVECWTCHCALQQARMETFLQAANLARAVGSDWLAEKFLENSRRIAMAMEHGVPVLAEAIRERSGR